MYQVVRRHWDFRFCGFGYFFRSVFVPKNFGFSVLVFIAVCRYSIFQHLVFGFRQKYQWVFGFDIRCGFRFFLFDRFGFRFLFDLSGNYAPPLPLNANVIEGNA